MKTKQLLVWSLSVLFLFSCSKTDLVSIPKNEEDIQNVAAPLPPGSNSSEPNNRAYIFVEPQSKYLMVKDYLRDSANQLATPYKFLGFFMGPAAAIQNNVMHYFAMPHWGDGRLPMYVAEIPQADGGFDLYGGAKKAFNFTTIKIPKGTIQGMAWVTILIPISAMQNDTKRQKSVYTYQKIGNTLVTNGTNQGFNYIMNSTMYSFVVNYQGNLLPRGSYRMYTTYPSTGLRLNFDSQKDVYIKGSGN